MSLPRTSARNGALAVSLAAAIVALLSLPVQGQTQATTSSSAGAKLPTSTAGSTSTTLAVASSQPASTSNPSTTATTTAPSTLVASTTNDHEPSSTSTTSTTTSTPVSVTPQAAAAAFPVGAGPVTPGLVSTFAGTGVVGTADGAALSATFDDFSGLSFDASGTLFIADYTRQLIRKITSAGVVSTFVSTAPYGAISVTVDSAGNIWATAEGSQIKKYSSAGVLLLTVGVNLQATVTDGAAGVARFSSARGMTADSAGNVYVVDAGRIRKVTSTGTVSTLAGSATVGSTDGQGAAASFDTANNLAIDATNNLYVTQSPATTATAGHKVRKVTPTGAVTTFAGAGAPGGLDGSAATATFTQPLGVTVDNAGNVYVTESGRRVRRISSAGVVSTIAGDPAGTSGYVDGTGAVARFWGPQTIAINSAGALFVGDYFNHRVRKIVQGVGSVSLPLAATLGSFSILSNGVLVDKIHQVIVDPVDTATGAFSHAETDVSVPVRGVPFELERTYDSRAAASGLVGPFGPGWGWNLTESIVTGTGIATWKSGAGQQIVFTLSGTTYTSPPGVIAQLVAVAGGGWKLVRSDQTTSTFDATGKLLSQKDRSGQGLTFGYTGAQLTTVTDAAAQAVTFTYGTAGVTLGLLVQVKTADLRTVGFGYTAAVAGATRLTSVTDPRGKTSTFTYTSVAPAGLLQSEIDPLAHAQFTNVYDATGRVTDQADPTGAHSTFVWNDTTGEMTMTDATTAVTKHQYTGNAFAGAITPSGTTAVGRDANLNPNRFADALGKVWNATYDARGNMLSRTSPLGFVESWTYDAFNNPLTHVDARGNTTSMTYDANGRQKTELRPLGVNFAWSWNPDGTLLNSTDPRGGITTYTYDTAGRIASQTTPLGFKTTYTYDAAGRVLTITDPRGNVAGGTAANYQQKFTYDASGNVLTSIDALGRTTTNVYDDAGNLMSSTAPDGGVTAYTYNTANEKVSVTAPNGGVTSYQYTSRGELFRTTLPDGDFATELRDASGRLEYRYEFGRKGRFWLYGYNSRDELISLADPAGRVTTYTYDDQGRRLTEVRPDGTTTTAYDQNGNVLSSTVTGIGVSSSTYDALNRVATTTDPRGKVTTYGYDLAGNKTSIIDPLLRKATFAYDADGRMTATVDPRGYAAGALTTDFDTLYTYDEVGNQRTVTDPLNLVTSTTYDPVNNALAQVNKRGQTTSYLYDPMNRVAKVTAPVVGATSFVYDTMGSVKTRTNPLLKVTSWDYDILNRKIKETDPLGRFFTFTYDNSQLATIVDANANAAANPALGTATLTYDNLRRLSGRSYSDGTPSVTFTYDAQGRRATMVDGTGTTTYGYDTANRVTTVTKGTDVFTYVYDNNSNVTSRKYPDGTLIAATFDDANQMASIVDPSGTVTYGYDLAGNPKTKALPNGVTSTLVFDNASRVQSVTNATSAATVSRFTYQRDSNGNPIGTDFADATGAVPGKTERLLYDNADRLVQACYATTTCTLGQVSTTAVPATQWTYDANGNRKTQSTGTSTDTYTYDDADELLTVANGQQFGTQSYTYNANGDAVTYAGGISQPGNTWTYNTARQMKTRDTSAFTYDGNGNRYQTTKGTTVTQDLWDTVGALPNLAIERTGAGAVQRKYTYGRGTEILRYTDLTNTTGGWYLTDAQGSVVNVTNGTGSATSTYSYDPWGNGGNNGATVGDNNPMLYTGQHLDTLGVYGRLQAYNMRARSYTPAHGRFTQTDPLPYGAGSAYESSFVYAYDNPLKFVDPNGKRGMLAGSGNVITMKKGGGNDSSGVNPTNLSDKDPESTGYCNKPYPSRTRLCAAWSAASAIALARTSGGGLKPGERNAARHCIWCAMMVWDIGFDGAYKFMKMHEGPNGQENNPQVIKWRDRSVGPDDGSDAADSGFDWNNNYVGVGIGQAMTARLLNTAADEATSKCQAALNSGQLDTRALVDR